MEEKTLGQIRVKADFNPDKDEMVDQIKNKAAELIDLIEAYSFSNVYLVGKAFKEVDTGFPIFENVGDLIQQFTTEPLSGFCILIKGSNSIQLDKVVSFL